MSVFNFDGYSEFCEWCENSGYDPDEEYDKTEESHKRDTWLFFYVKNIEDNTFAEVSVLVSYDHGWQEGEVHRQGLTRKVEQVLTEKITYV